MIVLILSSCVTNEEIATEYISTATGLIGLEAAEVYAEGIERTDSFQLYYNLAYSYLEAGEYEKAISTAEEALTIFPDALRFMYLKAYALREEGKIYSYELELKSILEKDPGNDQIRSMLLSHYLNIGRANDAEELAREIIVYDPTNQDALRALANSSEFYASIAPSSSPRNPSTTEKGWTVPPSLYMPLGVFNGDRMPNL